MLGVRLDPEIEQKLENLVSQTGRSKSYYVREALRAYLEEYEEYFIALSRLEKRGPRVTLEELESELGLEP